MLEGATAEDTIAELINSICESELLYSEQGILSRFIPLVISILKSPGKYKDDELQQTACLTLIRFMCVSSQFCDNNMPFLMNILKSTNNVKIKCNIVVGLSDFTFRFPNVIESWTSNIYMTLHEPNDKIRLTAVKMLSHMIMHEMIRVKGQISDLALCIVDTNEEIRNATQEFFKEISQKSNILYNVLPDIISRLSSIEMNLEEDKYHVIMRHIMGLIQKDRQVESLVEKLVLRFRVTNEERQWRDIAYCLALLTYTEKTIRKLIDNVGDFKDKLQIPEVYDSFKTIITNTNKLAKPELKAVVTDFAARIEDCLRVKDMDGIEGGDGDAPNSSSTDMPPPARPPPANHRGKGRASRKVAVVPSRKKQGHRRRAKSSSDESDDDDDVGGDKRSRGTSATNRSRARPQKPSKIIDSDDDSDD